MVDFRTSIRRISLPLLAVIAAVVCGGAAPNVQTYDQLKSLFDQQQYKALLPQLNQTLADKASTTKADDHYALLALKGETMLQLKVSDSASDAFRAASLVTGADDKSVAVAKATVLLIKRSSSLKYQPKAKAEDKKSALPPISILSHDDRKQAFAALFTDLLAIDQPQVTTAEQSSSLPTITSAAQQLADLRNVEIAATDADAQSKELLTKLATRATDLMNAVLKPMPDEIAKVEKAAGRTQNGVRRNAIGTPVGTITSTVGLSPQNESKLDNIISEAREISSAAAQMQPIFGDVGDFKAVKTDADKIVTDGDALLKKYKKATE
jgi:hypothetical protein